MITKLQDRCEELHTLLKALPDKNTYKSSSELNVILQKYLKILDEVNCYNAAYKSATSIFYSDIASIRDNFQNLLLADSSHEKDKAFEMAKHELESDLHALALLITTEEEVAL